MKTVVIIPTYNEKNNIGRIILKIFEIIPEIYILVVDDNSPDGTAGAVRRMQADYPNLSIIVRAKKEGLGRAYIFAIEKVLEDAEVENVILMDADFSHDPAYLPQICDLSKNYDVVIGSRYINGGGTSGWELWRRLLSKCGNFYIRMITRMPIKDCTGGFCALKASILKKINLYDIKSSGYAFLSEFKYLLYINGASFKELPIIFKNRVDGESKLVGHIVKEAILAPWRLILRKNK